VTWGVSAQIVPVTHSMTETVTVATKLARQSGLVDLGEDIVIVAGMPFGKAGTTNALRVATVTRSSRPEAEFAGDE
jgi:pyruvate kinase